MKPAIPHILQIWDNLSHPTQLSVRYLGEIITYAYQLLEHPVFSQTLQDEDVFIALMRNHPEQYKIFNRTIIERIIYESKHYGNVKFEFGILTISSQGIDNVVENLRNFVILADEIYKGGEPPESGAILHLFRLQKKGEIIGTIKYLLHPCRQLILNIKMKSLELDLRNINSIEQKIEWLERKKADLLHLQSSTDEVVFKGISEWIQIELNLCKSPNAEYDYLKELRPLVKNFLSKQQIAITTNQLLKHLLESEIDAFNSKLKATVLQVFSFHDIAGNEAEKVYHAFLLGLFQSFNGVYRVLSNREAGVGRFDIMLIPYDASNNGVIFEVKKLKGENDNVESALMDALNQIKERRYSTELKINGVKNYIGIAAAFLGKDLHTNWFVATSDHNKSD